MILSNIYAAVQRITTEWCQMSEKPWNVHALKHPCGTIKKPSECISLFQWGTSHSLCLWFSDFFEIVCFRSILLDDIKFLFSASKNPLKVRGKVNHFVSLAVTWGEEFKINNQHGLSEGESAEAHSEMWMKPHVNLKKIVSTGKGFPKAFFNLVRNKKKKNKKPNNHNYNVINTFYSNA